MNKRALELSFLFEPAPSNDPISAPWLLSHVDKNVWECSFGNEKMTIDFNIVLHDGSLLTHFRHQQLLRVCKRFLILQTSTYVTRGLSRSSRTEMDAVRRAIHVLDYFFLNGDRIQLATRGFELVTKDEIHHLVAQLSAGQKIVRTIYHPEKHVAAFARALIEASRFERSILLRSFDSSLAERSFAAKLRKSREKNAPLAVAEAPAALDESEIEAFQEILEGEGFYKVRAGGFQFSSTRVLVAAYGHRILNSSLRMDDVAWEVLGWKLNFAYPTEYPRAPVQTLEEDGRAAKEYLDRYLSTIESMEYFCRRGEPQIPLDALSAVRQIPLSRQEQLKDKGRFALLPFSVTETLFGRSIDFVYDYGFSIIACLAQVLETSDISRTRYFKGLAPLNITGWKTQPRDRPPNYASRLRSEMGIYEAFQLLVGAMDICVECCAARRTAELLSVKPTGIQLDDDDDFLLVAEAGKANVGDLHQLTASPVPPLVAHCLWLLRTLRESVQRAGGTVPTALLARPSAHAPLSSRGAKRLEMVAINRADLSECVDRLCDYFEVPLDSKGRRYYVRNHQLRRSFAYLFIWGGFFGGVDVLRKFLGQASAAECARYFTETTKGAALDLKARATAAAVQEDPSAFHELCTLLCDAHEVSVDELALLPTEDIAADIEAWMQEGAITVKCESFETRDGKNYRTVVLVKKEAV